MKNLTYLFIFILSLSACHSHSHDDHDHAHDGEGNHNEEDGKPSLVKTIWTSKTELFVEFPALIVGEESRFAAHFTILDNHKPVTAGEVLVELKDNQTVIASNRVDAPNSPGIFLPVIQAEKPGSYHLVFTVNSPSLIDTIVIKNVQVFSNEEDARNNIINEENNGISFLKEQAWKMDFNTYMVQERNVYDVINTSGVWKTSPNNSATISATTSGLVNFENENLTVGKQLKKGQLLMTINSASLNTENLPAEILKAQAELDQLKSEYERKKELYEDKIVPKSEFEIIEQQYKIAQANFNALSSGISSGGAKKITMPFDGYVLQLDASNGGYVEQGGTLLSVSKNQASVLEAHVNPSFSSELNDIHDVLYKRNESEWSSMLESNGKILAVSKKVDNEHPFLSVFTEVNDAIIMPEGSFTEVQIVSGQANIALVVPESALLEDYGTFSVIIQTGGESFEKRTVSIGKRNGNWVEIIDGLGNGEVVVSQGAYQVKMASMAGQAPAHGHAH